MRRFKFAVLALASTTALSACESIITGGPLIRPGEPTGVIEVVNATSRNVDTVAISDCDANTYGLDRLPSGTVIPPGGRYRFTVSAGCWDVDAGAYGGGGAEARQRMQVAAGGGVRYTVTE